VADGTEGVSFELALDLRRLRWKALLILLAVVWDPVLESLSLELDDSEELEELEELNASAKTPG